MPASAPAKTSLSRVFVIENRAGPRNAPTYMSWGRAGGVDQALGDSTRIEVPSETRYGKFDVIGSIRGAKENAEFNIMFVYPQDKSEILQIARKGCPVDIQVHIGQCEDPRDFDSGWKKIVVGERADLTNYGLGDLGALESGEDAKVDEEVDASAWELYEVLRMTFAERAKAETAQEVIDIVVCDDPSCGDCGVASDGCSLVYALAAPAGSSPGLLPEIIFSDDGFVSASDTPLTTFAIGEDPTGMACVGSYLVVISNDTESLHYAALDDIQDADETWVEVTTGFVAAAGPNAIDSYAPRYTWIVGDGGYIYFTADPVNGVSVQDAGVLTSENLQAVYAFNSKTVVAVGDNNTVLFTTDGSTWQAVTGPDASGAPALLSVYCRTADEWWVGTDDGKLYYTLDQGAHWYEKAFPGSGTGNVRDILFASDTVGFIAHDTGSAGRILRTVSGGYTWYILPEGSGTIPANDRLNALAVCSMNENKLFAGGLGDDAEDGIILVGGGS